MVADQTMYQFYKDGLEEYLLTIANMVCYYLLWVNYVACTRSKEEILEK